MGRYMQHPVTDSVHWQSNNCDEEGCRAVVVLDPRGDLDPFCKALVEAMDRAGDRRSAAIGVHPATVRATLRSLIAPPRPEEPTGLGAVVEAINDNHFVRVATANEGWLRVEDRHPGPLCTYRDIDVVRVISEGVQS